MVAVDLFVESLPNYDKRDPKTIVTAFATGQNKKSGCIDYVLSNNLCNQISFKISWITNAIILNFQNHEFSRDVQN